MAGRQRTLDAVAQLIDELREEGYRFLTLSGLIEHAAGVESREESN